MFQERYVYHIKDSYFEKVQDDKLMCNKENGQYRPTFFCMEDTKVHGLYWVVPMSSKVEKYVAIRNQKIKQYGKCDTIVIGSFDRGESAFLLQNMFPVTEQYLDHIHTRNGNPVAVSYPLAQEIKQKMQIIRHLVYQGKKVVFTDVKRLEKLMIEELTGKPKEISYESLNLDGRIDKIEQAKQSPPPLSQADKTEELAI